MTHAFEKRRRERIVERKPSRSVDIFNSRWLQSFGYALRGALLGVLCHSLSSGKLDRWQHRAADLHGFRSLLGGRDANTAREPCCVVRLWRVHEDPGGVVPARRMPFTRAGRRIHRRSLLVLAPLALLPYRSAFITWDMVTLLGCVAVVYLIVRRRAAIALALGLAVYRVEFYRRAKRISDGIAAGRFAAFPRSPAGDGRRVYRLSDLQAAIRHLVPGRSHRLASMARDRQRRGYGGVVGRWLGHPVRCRAVGGLSRTGLPCRAN